jgi:hypothetical protein
MKKSTLLTAVAASPVRSRSAPLRPSPANTKARANTLRIKTDATKTAAMRATMTTVAITAIAAKPGVTAVARHVGTTPSTTATT